MLGSTPAVARARSCRNRYQPAGSATSHDMVQGTCCQLRLQLQSFFSDERPTSHSRVVQSWIITRELGNQPTIHSHSRVSERFEDQLANSIQFRHPGLNVPVLTPPRSNGSRAAAADDH